MELDKEILQDFQIESEGLMDELEAVVEELEDSAGGGAFPEAKMKEFAQKVDRIMGTAKTLLTMGSGHSGITFLANVSEMCKTMGYQAVALQRASLLPIFAGFWAETVEVMREVLAALTSADGGKSVVAARSAHLEKRLQWLAEKVAPGNEAEKQKVIALLKKL
jgi:chemotaxis protein histidine kinase CheA